MTLYPFSVGFRLLLLAFLLPRNHQRYSLRWRLQNPGQCGRRRGQRGPGRFRHTLREYRNGGRPKGASAVIIHRHHLTTYQFLMAVQA